VGNIMEFVWNVLLGAYILLYVCSIRAAFFKRHIDSDDHDAAIFWFAGLSTGIIGGFALAQVL